MELGFQYGDEDLEETQNYKIGGAVIDAIANEMNLNENMPYNLRITKPALSESPLIEEQGYYTYVRPPRCLKILTPGITEYGELILSKKSDLRIEYLEKLSLEDIPAIYQRLITLELAFRMARAVGKPKAMETIYPLLTQEYDKLYLTENIQMDLTDDGVTTYYD